MDDTPDADVESAKGIRLASRLSALYKRFFCGDSIRS